MIPAPEREGMMSGHFWLTDTQMPAQGAADQVPPATSVPISEDTL